LHGYELGEAMTTDVEKKDMMARYDKFPKWGKKADEANQERIVVTQSLIPGDVRTILDLGCGDGIVTNEFIEKGVDVFGTDFSIAALGFMKGKRLVSSVNNIPFPDQYFDLVLCTEVIEHLPDEVYERTLSEIERVAKHYVVISTPNDEYLPSLSIRCENCKNVFHRNLHVQSFNRDVHSSLFKIFKLKKTIGIQVWEQLPGLVDFQRNLLGVYTPGRGAICPACNHVNNGKPGIWQRLVLELGRRITHLVPGAKTDRWIVSLYQRDSGNS
jgi:2-polyprenyl-3-methyl-5-hydroxy-6-metoxy-1,4-benzoquinol methylase